MTIQSYKNKQAATDWILREDAKQPAAIFHGDCEDLLRELPRESVSLAISSPPYCMGKSYEDRADDLEQFVENHERILPLVVAALKPGGSLCWQVGYHIRKRKQITTPLDFLIYGIASTIPELKLRNRIVWTFGHGLHCTTRFSGRHETVLWFTKGDGYDFDLDAVRVAQKYPGKRHSKGPKKGEPSGNPAGKNPGDVWDIPNVKGNHIEKTDHPCQFPVGLAQRFIRALTKPGDLVFDPFCGVGSSGAAAVLEGRRFIGAETEERYAKIAKSRIESAARGQLKYRPAERAIHVPSPTSQVGLRPPSFAIPSSTD